MTLEKVWQARVRLREEIDSQLESFRTYLPNDICKQCGDRLPHGSGGCIHSLREHRISTLINDLIEVSAEK